jgi:putative flavoprotein involved in K+ transport
MSDIHAVQRIRVHRNTFRRMEIHVDQTVRHGNPERCRVVVIGGGQAGLAAAYHLSARAIDFVVLEANSRIGESWRQRWDSLQLFTPAKLCGLPGSKFPLPPNAFPRKNDVADYLTRYATQSRLPIYFDTKVTSLTRSVDEFTISAGQYQFTAESVIVATGPYQLPRIPSWASRLDPGIFQLHAGDYRNPSHLPRGDVLVVGAGNTGAELALELKAAGHNVLLSGRDVGQVPAISRLGNGRLFWFLATRVLSLATPLGRKINAEVRAGHGGPLVRLRSKQIASAGIERVARVARAWHGLPLLEDGRIANVRSILWCTGFKTDFSWIQLPIFDKAGLPVHDRGCINSMPGLYFVGLPFQRSLSSTLVGGVARDAEHVVRQISSAKPCVA